MKPFAMTFAFCTASQLTVNIIRGNVLDSLSSEVGFSRWQLLLPLQRDITQIVDKVSATVQRCLQRQHFGWIDYLRTLV